MNEQDLDLLSAYLDGELSSEDAVNVKSRLLAEPAFREAHDSLLANDELMMAFAAQMNSRPVPSSVDTLLQPKLVGIPAVGDTDTVATAATEPTSVHASGQQQWLAMAAAVLVAVGLIGFQLSESDVPSIENTLSGQSFGTEVGDTLVVATFMTSGGEVCRELKSAVSRSIVCRADKQWQTTLEVPVSASADGFFQPAGENDVTTIDAYVMANKSGDALTAEQEQALIAAGWRHAE